MSNEPYKEMLRKYLVSRNYEINYLDDYFTSIG